MDHFLQYVATATDLLLSIYEDDLNEPPSNYRGDTTAAPPAQLKRCRLLHQHRIPHMQKTWMTATLTVTLKGPFVCRNGGDTHSLLFRQVCQAVEMATEDQSASSVWIQQRHTVLQAPTSMSAITAAADSSEDSLADLGDETISSPEESGKSTSVVHKGDLDDLMTGLLISDEVESAQRVQVPSRKALCMMLWRLAYPDRLCDLKLFFFNRHSSVVSSVVSKVLAHIEHSFAHLMADLTVHKWLSLQSLELLSQIREEVTHQPLAPCSRDKGGEEQENHDDQVGEYLLPAALVFREEACIG
ncbi:hypothetical protein HPB50_008435 [Hyalomma asiaticum]|uniref:Uncharacterized protein n=1 Tax=Hyalomma asiaticum TaxID=266040 RepID=A0ACB7T6Q1_HYAAI|nr:hypothetical protein HPB50_008435 [Hyalomma asiaticum]